MNRLVVVSNRVPLPSAGSRAGGLAVALDGLMERRGGLWFGWSGRIAEAATPLGAVARAGSVDYATIDLTQEEYSGYYNGFSNGVLWPLLHTMPQLMRFDRRDAALYRAVNARMAASLQPLLRPDDMIWIHDYHLLPLAAELRARGVANPIGFFLHIPFAAPDVLGAAPEVAELVRDLLAADLIGFQTDRDMANFAAAAHDFAGAVRLHGGAVQFAGRRVRLGVFPVEIEATAFAATARRSAESPAVQRLGHSLAGQQLILGVDRLDPTKGLLQRVAGFRQLLETRTDLHQQVTLLQIAAESRTEVSCYQALRAALDSAAGSLNADLGTPDWQPLRLVSRAIDRTTVAGYLRLARVGLVTPLRDGMNLVAKEFVAAQDPDDPGVLVLSCFAGAARQLSAAVLVNPHDPDALAEALESALRMGRPERQERWQALWQAIADRSPAAWGRSFIAGLLHNTRPHPARPEPRRRPVLAPLTLAETGGRDHPQPGEIRRIH